MIEDANTICLHVVPTTTHSHSLVHTQYIELSYEQLLADKSGFDKVAPFLDAHTVDGGGDDDNDDGTPVAAASKVATNESIVRLHPKTCAEKVSNWDEVVRVLRKKGKQRYIDMCEAGSRRRSQEEQKDAPPPPHNLLRG